MSRIGKMPISVPNGVEIKIGEGNLVTVKGPKGTLERRLSSDMNIALENGQLEIKRPNDLKKYRALHGLTRTLINNMVVGVTEGYKKTLEINGVGYRAAKNGNKLALSLGYSHPVEMTDPEGVTSEVEGTNKIIVSGIDKEKVGQYAANIREKRPPEPYKGKGIKYDTERIRRKAGKAGKK
ncbi:MAG: 50S ribosomal protein L6 [Defluviitaleaceae bacterium]|nr:50S ribosomal protein L6 [Defluviitaleaceae bacterium]